MACLSHFSADDVGSCKPNCKPTAQHVTAPGITGSDGGDENTEPKRTVSYSTAQDNMRIIELENRCTGNRTVGSNPTLSAIRCLGPEQADATVWLSPSGVYANRKSDWRPDKAVGPSPSLLARVRPDVRSRLCGCREVRVVGRLRFR